MIVIGIDPSINHTGVAEIRCDEDKKIILGMNVLKLMAKDTYGKLYELWDIIHRTMIGLDIMENEIKVIIEQPLMYSRKSYTGKSFNIASVIKLNMAFTSIYLAVKDIANEIILKPAPSGYGKNKRGLPTKENARYILQAHFTDPKDIERIKNADLNIVDALMLAVWGCQEGG